MNPNRPRATFRTPQKSRDSAYGARTVALLGLSQTQQLAKQEFARARRYDYPLTIGVCRIDRIEQLTDLYGAESRALLMEELARVFSVRSRATDIVGRLSEDRLLWVLPHTDLDGSRLAAERIREAVETIELRSGRRSIQVGISIGLSCFVSRNTLFFDSVLMQAQEALLRAQERGGNQIEWHPLPELLEATLRKEAEDRDERDRARGVARTAARAAGAHPEAPAPSQRHSETEDGRAARRPDDGA
ncbi:MAG TPA: GGDEF domain-containing protein [Planctomycetota bacterium]|nr:GGDEF domain-containing protein [Planctomycetota bacterium]